MEMFPSVNLIGEFGSFTFVRELATGGQGTVFIARVGQEKGMEVAVKAIRLQLEVTEEERVQRIAYLETAMHTIKSLHHPNIVRHFQTAFYNVSLSTDFPRYYISMELCKGTLAREARRRPINGFYLQKWTRDILNGLAHLHANRIVHRDLKADNVFLDTDDLSTCVMKIGDLGDIKHLLDSFQAVSESRGTYAHMSPEMIKGTISSHHQIFQKTDIWSFGCVLIEMLTGTLPQFINRQTQNGQPLVYKGRGCEMPIMFFVGRGGRPEIMDEWPDTAKEMIRRCLDVDPQSRPTAAELLEYPLMQGKPPMWSRGGLGSSFSVEGQLSPCPSLQSISDPEKMSSFTVIKGLAYGSYGMVYHVKMKDGAEVAMKCVSLEPVDKDQKEDVKAVQCITQSLLKLRHKNIVSHLYSGSLPFSALSANRHFYIAMELCHGGKLAVAIRRLGPLEGTILRRWVKDLIGGLAYLHENRIVHRTLNTHNIFLTSENSDVSNLKIGGLCDGKQLRGDVTDAQEVPVVQRYFMSPEMINGSMSAEFQIGRRTDIWNFGLVLIEMLTGKGPRFMYRTPDGKKEKQCTTSQEIMFFVGCCGRPQIPNTWPSGWRGMINRCVQISPAARPSAMELLKEVSGGGERGYDGLRKSDSSSKDNCAIT